MQNRGTAKTRCVERGRGEFWYAVTGSAFPGRSGVASDAQIQRTVTGKASWKISRRITRIASAYLSAVRSGTGITA